MKKLLFIPVIFMACGCLNRLTQRLDAMREEIVQMSAKLDESNRLLANVEKSTGKLARVVPVRNNGAVVPMPPGANGK